MDKTTVLKAKQQYQDILKQWKLQKKQEKAAKTNDGLNWLERLQLTYANKIQVLLDEKTSPKLVKERFCRDR